MKTAHTNPGVSIPYSFSALTHSFPSGFFIHLFTSSLIHSITPSLSVHCPLFTVHCVLNHIQRKIPPNLHVIA